MVLYFICILLAEYREAVKAKTNPGLSRKVPKRRGCFRASAGKGQCASGIIYRLWFEGQAKRWMRSVKGQLPELQWEDSFSSLCRWVASQRRLLAGPEQ